MSLAQHPFIAVTDPGHSRLVRLSAPFPEWLNPFTSDRLTIQAAAIPGDVEHTKPFMARELLLGRISEGLISERTIVKKATSGNTGHGIAKICKARGISCQLIMRAGTARAKINAISIMGGGVKVVLHIDPSKTPVGRRAGRGSGRLLQPRPVQQLEKSLAHETAAALAAAGDVLLMAVASGTMATCIRLRQYVGELGLRTRIFPVLLEEHQDVPGERPLSKVQRDVKFPWLDLFSLDDIEFGTRHPFFFWPVIPGESCRRCSVRALVSHFGARCAGGIRKSRPNPWMSFEPVAT